MKSFKMRITIPEQTDWFIVNHEFLSEAIQDFQLKMEIGIPIVLEPPDFSTREVCRLAVVEVEGFGEYISKYYFRGIFRSGGIKTSKHWKIAIREAAELLGWKDDPMRLIEEWPGAETWDEARETWTKREIDLKRVTNA